MQKYKVIVTDMNLTEDEKPLVEETITVDLPDEKGKLRKVSVEDGPMIDYIYTQLFA